MNQKLQQERNKEETDYTPAFITIEWIRSPKTALLWCPTYLQCHARSGYKITHNTYRYKC